MNRARVYHRCHFCEGEVLEQRVTVDYRWGEDLLAIIQNVPAGVCQICGERYLKAEVVKKMQKLANSKRKPSALIKIPVRELELA